MAQKKALSICIPTYNRRNFLENNLNQLLYYLVNETKLNSEIEIIVSNNCSTDSTKVFLDEFYKKEHNYITLKIYHQENPLNIPEQMIFVAEKASGKFFMWLGDDDYIENEYLRNVVDLLQTKNIECIIPSFQCIDIQGDKLNVGRDLDLPNKFYKPSFNCCVKNSWRGHQMSGLVFSREIINEYYKRNVKNLYPFIFFTSLSCLLKNTYHLTEYPIKVTQPGQSNKAWNYGKDGLLNEVFDNYKKLPLNCLQKTILQLHFYKKQSWRLWGYKRNGIKEFFKAFINIWRSKNSTSLFKLLFPFEVVFVYVYHKVKNIVKK